jgi:predicted lactoylglutathione lyase
MMVDDNIFVMLLTEPHFKGFINNALAAGGKEWQPKMDYGNM